MDGPALTGPRVGPVRLGAGGPVVGAQGLGCMGMSEFYGATDDVAAGRTLRRALDLGVTLWDTADAYGFGRNEELLAPFVRAHRDRVVIATKFGLRRRWDEPRYRAVDNSPGYLRRAVEASLRRLGVQCIDLYYAHRLDPAVPVEDTVGAMATLVAEGKVRHLGLCEVTGAQLRAAHRVHPVAAVQSEWSLFSREVERDMVPAAADLGVAVVPYSPLGRGLLTGGFPDPAALAADDFRRHMPRFAGGNATHNTALLAPLRDVGAARGLTAGQVALAWVHQRGEAHGIDVVPIPGTRHPGRLTENAAASAVRLTTAELAELEPLADRVAGARDPGLTFARAA